MSSFQERERQERREARADAAAKFFVEQACSDLVIGGKALDQFDEVSHKVREVAAIAARFFPQIAYGLVESAEMLSSDEISRRLDIALQALRGEDVFISARNSMRTAREMVDSYTFDKKTGVSTFTVPAGVSDVEAMKALNFFTRRGRSWGSDLIHSDWLNFFEELPKEFGGYCKERDYSQARQITITAVVKGTAGKDRFTQERIIRQKSLVFADPRDQALAAAIHYMAEIDGVSGFEDLFNGLCVRGSLPDMALLSGVQGNGVGIIDFNDLCGDDGFDGVIAASGTPAPRAK